MLCPQYAYPVLSSSLAPPFRQAAFKQSLSLFKTFSKKTSLKTYGVNYMLGEKGDRAGAAPVSHRRACRARHR